MEVSAPHTTGQFSTSCIFGTRARMLLPYQASRSTAKRNSASTSLWVSGGTSGVKRRKPLAMNSRT